MDYKTLSSLPAEAYLNSERFVTAFDAMHKNRDTAARQYQHGMDVGKRANRVHIAVNSVWSASMKDGGSLQSYEGIGYHACTADLLRGFLDSGVTIVVHRYADDGRAVSAVTIK